MTGAPYDNEEKEEARFVAGELILFAAFVSARVEPR